MFIDLHTHRPASPGVFAIRNDLSPAEAEAQGGYCSVGIHPWTLTEKEPDVAALVVEAQQPRVLAIGECGIDRVHRPFVDEKRQSELFLMHANLAVALRKPLILHCVRADDLIRQFRQHLFADAPPWFFHGFNGSPESAAQLTRMGIPVSIGPRFLEGPKPERLHDFAEAGFFLESDDSGLPIEEVYALAAEILDLPVASLETQIKDRFCTLLRLPV